MDFPSQEDDPHEREQVGPITGATLVVWVLYGVAAWVCVALFAAAVWFGVREVFLALGP